MRHRLGFLIVVEKRSHSISQKCKDNNYGSKANLCEEAQNNSNGCTNHRTDDLLSG